MLEDRTIDNTMEGAKKRIQDFYDYKTKDKNVLLGEQLDLEGLYNNLAIRLSHNKRPDFTPELGLKEIGASMKHLEECEAERKVALHAELNRQIRLVNLDEQHKARFEKLKAWVGEKESYLKTKEEISSVSQAQLHLRLLDAYDKESGALYESTVAQWKKLGEELTNQKYERTADLNARESEIDADFKHLQELSAAKRPVLQDDLARETFKENVRLKNQQHIEVHSQLVAWHGEKEAYLKNKEEISSVKEAKAQLSLLDGYGQEEKGITESSVAYLKQLGAEILAAKYETQYSSYTFENPDEVNARESDIDAKWQSLSDLSAEKRRVLDDDLARETFAERTRVNDVQHANAHAKFVGWYNEKEAYLKTKEAVNSVSEAQTQISILDGYEQEAKGVTDSSVASLKVLGAEILAAKYETQYSSYVFEKPEEIKTREQDVDSKLAHLSQLSAEKRSVLEDDLARETFAERTRVTNKQHINAYTKLVAWYSEKEAYLKKKEDVNSVSEAQTQLSLLDGYEQEEKGVTGSNVAFLKQLGEKILTAKYETQYSSYVFENPEEVKTRESDIASKWEALAQFKSEKRQILDDDLARENFADAVRTLNRNHIDKFNKLSAWVGDKKKYLNKKEDVGTVSEANTQLSVLETYESEKTRKTETNVAALKAQGAEIAAKKYETSYSSWVFEHPDEIKARESEIDAHWVELDELAAAKKSVLEADLARELEKERLRIEYAHLAGDFVQWSRDTAEDVAASHFGFTLHEVEAYRATLNREREAHSQAADEKKAAAEAVFKQGGDLGVTENIYTKVTLEELGQARESLAGGLAAVEEAYGKELARQQANDELCKQFGDLVDPFSKWIVDQKDTITQSKETLEAQLAFVDGKIATVDADGAALASIHQLEEEIKAKGITNNRHTNLSHKDVEVQYAQYKDFLGSKRKMLADEIEQEKLKGLTASDLKEIEDNFKQFDAGAKGFLDKRELKACLYSLGEEKTRAEIESIAKDHSAGGEGETVPFEGFKAYMVGVLGVSDTKEDILDGFAIINRSDELPGKLANLQIVLAEQDLKYIESTAPAVEGGIDFRAWTEDVFAR